MTTEDDFQTLLDVDPRDHLTRLVLSDWLQERGDPRAEGYRALGILRRHPWLYVGTGRWGYFSEMRCWMHNPITKLSHLPHDWVCMFAMSDRYSYYTRESATRRAAEDAAAYAFTKLRSRRRAELLRSNQEG